MRQFQQKNQQTSKGQLILIQLKGQPEGQWTQALQHFAQQHSQSLFKTPN